MTCINHFKTPAGTSYLVQGEGAPVVLIHGVGLDKSMWGGQLVGLSPSYQIIAYDMLGHGDSAIPGDDTCLKEYATQLKELLDHLGLEKALVIGFSMGGLVARAFALHYPQYLNGLVILNSVFNRTEEQRSGVMARTREVAIKGPAANVETALKRWFSEEYAASSPAQINAVRNRVLSNDHQGYLKTYQLFASEDNYMVDQLKEIQAPTLVMTGELDPGSTPQMARDMAALIPNAKACVIDDERHMMPMESPKRVNEKLLSFLSAVYSTQPSSEEAS
ncbi:alpha/beta fold hydrolase [Marinobacterium jannaschii]|uniref:alpha/beta fold hydrolase n=1 Tax=Marinobacterium jannaschii TaxID=64970 RepID=UPI000486455B|nr:alpha/beta fold hydrolase [Marinobacterium jannaschii]